MKRTLAVLSSVFCVVALFLACPAWAAYPANYPDKPVRYIIPFAPGGESDIGARFQQIAFKKKFGQELIVESKPGAGGALAWAQTNTFPGDGYTIMSTNLPHIVLQPMEGQVQYKTDDIANVYFYQYTPDAIVVRSESQYKTLQDLVRAAKEKPESVSLAGSGINTANHMAAERLNAAAGIKTTYVPFKGTARPLEISIARKKYTVATAAPEFATVNSYSVAAFACCVKLDVLTPDVLCVPQPVPVPPLHASASESNFVVITALSAPVLVA